MTPIERRFTESPKVEREEDQFPPQMWLRSTMSLLMRLEKLTREEALKRGCEVWLSQKRG